MDKPTKTCLLVIKWSGFTSASQGLVQAHLKFKVGSAVPPKVQTEPKQAKKVGSGMDHPYWLKPGNINRDGVT